MATGSPAITMAFQTEKKEERAERMQIFLSVLCPLEESSCIVLPNSFHFISFVPQEKVGNVGFVWAHNKLIQNQASVTKDKKVEWILSRKLEVFSSKIKTGISLI